MTSGPPAAQGVAGGMSVGCSLVGNFCLHYVPASRHLRPGTALRAGGQAHPQEIGRRLRRVGRKIQEGVSGGGRTGRTGLAWGRGREELAAGAVLRLSPCAPRRSDTSIACIMPAGALPAPVPVCVRFEHRGCARGNLSFTYMQNPVITAISPRRSPVR